MERQSGLRAWLQIVRANALIRASELTTMWIRLRSRVLGEPARLVPRSGASFRPSLGDEALRAL
jgi:hypothetical protein